MTARVLANTGTVNLLFQPFNSSQVSRSQWEVWDEDSATPNTERFLSGLLEGSIDQEYVQSGWFYRYSSSVNPSTTQLNLIKDTNLHLKLRWLRARFPQITVVGLWRDPMSIMDSLCRNQFDQQWYGYVTKEIVNESLRQCGLLECYGNMLREAGTHRQILAVGVALRIHYHVLNSDPRDWFCYDDLVESPTAEFSRLGDRLDIDVSVEPASLNADYNVAGRLSRSPRRRTNTFSEVDSAALASVFAPVRKAFDLLREETRSA